MAKGTLGPFPKTWRWREILGATLPVNGEQLTLLADHSICRLKATLEELLKDPDALKAVIFWVMLPIATREQKLPVEPDLTTLPPGPARTAVEATLLSISDETPLLEGDKWRAYDGPEFCNLAYRFYSNLNRELFRAAAPDAPEEMIDTFAREMAVITRAFSARWFNACARLETPETGSIRWYFGHCLGKLDLELSREMSDWVEQPRKRKGEPEPALDL